MNNFSQVRDLLQHNQQLHSRSAQFYRELAQKSVDEKVKMLLAILAKHEAQLGLSLDSYISEAPAKILNTYFQFDHERAVAELFGAEHFKHPVSASEVEAIATQIDNYYCELYREMLAAVDCEQVQALFENLLTHMLEQKKRLSIDMYSMLDM